MAGDSDTSVAGYRTGYARGDDTGLGEPGEGGTGKARGKGKLGEPWGRVQDWQGQGEGELATPGGRGNWLRQGEGYRTGKAKGEGGTGYARAEGELGESWGRVQDWRSQGKGELATPGGRVQDWQSQGGGNWANQGEGGTG